MQSLYEELFPHFPHTILAHVGLDETFDLGTVAASAFFRSCLLFHSHFYARCGMSFLCSVGVCCLSLCFCLDACRRRPVSACLRSKRTACCLHAVSSPGRYRRGDHLRQSNSRLGRKVYESVKHLGRVMMFWADILQGFDDEALLQVPPDVLAMEWGYEDDHPFFENCQRLADAGIPFYVCPGTSSWNSFMGRTANCIENIRNACSAAQRLSAQGLLVGCSFVLSAYNGAGRGCQRDKRFKERDDRRPCLFFLNK